jgi:hypothetical protein
LERFHGIHLLMENFGHARSTDAPGRTTMA